MKVLFVAGFGPSVREMQTALAFYRDSLGLPIVEGEDVSTKEVDGVKYFSLRPLADAAESCEAATQELRGKGYRLLVEPKTEPRGQTVARLLSPRVCSSE